MSNYKERILKAPRVVTIIGAKNAEKASERSDGAHCFSIYSEDMTAGTYAVVKLTEEELKEVPNF